MRYLITGATGFIGKSLIERLNTHEHTIMTINRSWEYDSDLPKKIKKFNPDYIIHCAAEIKNSSKTFSSNVLFTNWLLENTLNINYKAFINIGSSSEYGKTNTCITEKKLLKPRTMYEATKGASTLLCLGYANEYDKPIAVVRPFSVYGINEPEKRLIPTLFRNFSNNISSQISLGVHDFIHIDDFLDGLLLVAYSESELIKGDIINLGFGVQYSNLEVFNIIKTIFNSKLDYIKINNIFNKYDSLNWVSDITYAKSKYKFNPKYTLETGLKKIYETNYKQIK
jgi:nucleoside-diphosphate-sugar epimerase